MSVALLFKGGIVKENASAYLSLVPINGACMLLMAYCGVLFLPLSCLTGYHMYIISAGETTKEDVKKVYDGGENPNDFGCPMNWWLTFCTSMPPSKLTNLRDYVGDENENDDVDDEESGGSELTSLTNSLASPTGTDMEEPESCPGLSVHLRGGAVPRNGEFQALSQSEELDNGIEMDEVNPLTGGENDWDQARVVDLEAGMVEVGTMQGRALGNPVQIEARLRKVQQERDTLWKYFQSSPTHVEELAGESFDDMILAVEGDPNYDIEGLAGWAEANCGNGAEAEAGDQARWELDFSVAVMLMKMEGYPVSTRVSIAFGEILLTAM